MGKRVLVVEDDEFIREVIAASLDDSGFNVDAFADSQGLWQHLKRHRPNLVLLDLSLPDTDGLAICRRLRASSGTAAVPIIIVSAMSQPLTIRAAFEAGATAFIKKPFDIDELVGTAHACVDDSTPSSISVPFSVPDAVRRAG